MNYALAELLSREEMLKILRERELNTADMETLPHDELMRVYKTFAVPLPRRESKNNKSKSGSIPSAHNNGQDQQSDTSAAYPVQKRNCYNDFIEIDKLDKGEEPAQCKRIRCSNEVKITTPAVRKRALQTTRTCSPTEDSLSTETKRCKITWPTTNVVIR